MDCETDYITMYSPHPFRRVLCRVLAIVITVPWPILLPPLPARADDTNSGPIIIEEIAWAGSSLSQADEWIEIANVGDATTTIAGWSIRGASGLPIFLPDNAEIAPHGTYLLSNYPETDEKSSISVPVQLATTTVVLSNSALLIELVDADGAIRDVAGSGGIPPAGLSAPKATMIRAATSPTDLLWMSATSSVGFKAAITDFGEPGLCRLCALPAIEDLPELSPGEAMDELVPPEEATTSTTAEPPLPDPISTTSSTEAIETTVPTSTAEIVPVPFPSQTTTSTSPETGRGSASPLHVTLNEVMSNPAAGPEWVELRIAEMDATSTHRALELWDAAGRFMMIPAHTAMTAPGYLVVTLASARLNNGGDDLSLRETTGVAIEFIQLPTLEDGVAFAKNESGSWAETNILTPSAANKFPTIVTAPVTATAPEKTETKTAIVSPTSRSETSSTSTSASTSPLHVALNEVMSNPDGGKEWVELRIAETDAPTTDRPYELWDASGRIATIPMGTAVTAPGYLLVALSSARLNNGGDEVSLREAGGDITLDTIEVPGLNNGIAWARDEAGAWTDTTEPTPGAPNNITGQKSGETLENKERDDEPSTGITSAKKSLLTSSLTDASIMPNESTVSARVRLVGTVGSVPRLLGATHAFILLGEDGRAAIAYLPKHLHTPRFGSTVRVMGSLTATERQLELRMKATDVWMTIATSTPPRPRDVDFLAPGMEDAWGLVTATGTVKTTGTKSVVIDADGVDVTVNIPTAVGYRAKRLVKGDVIHITGLLDPRKEDPTVLIRVPEDIELMAHAPDTVAPTGAGDTKKSGGLPDWTPFGAAAGAVAATGGLQRLRTYLRRRKLEAMAAQTP